LLVLKLGYSRSLQVAFSAYKLRVKVSKNVITIQGQNFSEVGDFTRRVSRLRVPDAYKGKGFWYKDEVRSLKELKKK
jgi:ribosomal protein L6P/L9E